MNRSHSRGGFKTGHSEVHRGCENPHVGFFIGRRLPLTHAVAKAKSSPLEEIIQQEEAAGPKALAYLLMRYCGCFGGEGWGAIAVAVVYSPWYQSGGIKISDGNKGTYSSSSDSRAVFFDDA